MKAVFQLCVTGVAAVELQSALPHDVDPAKEIDAVDENALLQQIKFVQDQEVSYKGLKCTYVEALDKIKVDIQYTGPEKELQEKTGLTNEDYDFSRIKGKTGMIKAVITVKKDELEIKTSEHQELLGLAEEFMKTIKNHSQESQQIRVSLKIDKPEAEQAKPVELVANPGDMSFKELMQYTLMLQKESSRLDDELDDLQQKQKEYDVQAALGEFRTKMVEVDATDPHKEQALYVGTPVALEYHNTLSYAQPSGTKGFVSSPSGDTEDFWHGIDAYNVMDVTFPRDDSTKVINCFKFDKANNRLTLEDVDAFFAMVDKPVPEEMKIKGLHVVTIDEFPVPNKKLADEFIEHSDETVDGKGKTKFKKFMDSLPKVRGFRKAEPTLMTAFKKSLDRPSEHAFQLQLGQPIGHVKVKRAHLKPLEHSDLAEHVWDSMKKTQPRDPTWKKWFNKLEKNFKYATEYVNQKWKALQAFFNNAWTVVKNAFRKEEPKKADVITRMKDNHDSTKAKAAVAAADDIIKSMRKQKEWKKPEKSIKIRTIKIEKYPALFNLPESVEFMEILGFENRWEADGTFVFKGESFANDFLPIRKVLNGYLDVTDPMPDGSKRVKNHTKSGVNGSAAPKEASFVQVGVQGPITKEELEMYSMKKIATACRATVGKMTTYLTSKKFRAAKFEL